MNLAPKGKAALVTGSTRGTGFAIAKQLLQEGTGVIGRSRAPCK